MLIIIKKINKMYGGYEYIEVDTLDRVYSTGSSRGHAGHARSYGVDWLDVIVNTNKELEKNEQDLTRQGFKEVNNMYVYQREKEKEEQ